MRAVLAARLLAAGPGGEPCARWVEPDGGEVAIVVRGDAADVYYGREEIRSLSITPATALRLAWFILWRWWVRAGWCGLRLRLWHWALARGGGVK